MYNKFLVVASKQDLAGVNITTQLSQFRKNFFIEGTDIKKFFDFYLIDDSILHTGNLAPNKIDDYDFIIFASKHSSEKKEKTLSIHAPGNWGRADLGGASGKICKTSALFQKQTLQKLKSNARKNRLDKHYKITMEVTHHGPLINKPCFFIEIGSTETEWKDRRAGFVIAKTIAEIILEFKENPYSEIGIGIGGPHYCPSFTKLQLNSNVAFSHVIPQYAMPITEEMIREAWEKTEEEVDFAVVDWKGLGVSEERKKVIAFLEKNNLPWKKTKDIKR